ncbi:Xaa-Pro peptidase family protein [Desulfobacterota bacterium AH_259_B03_O07]|nr:Xaa-Pro peptidase family protein [Desulfobacterota bacterium AH_259_B03_O07]
MKEQSFLIIDSSENSADLYYRTNFFVPDPIIFIEHKGEKILVLNELEIERGKRDAKVDKVLSFSEYLKKLPPKKRKKRIITNIVDLIFKELKIKGALVPGRFPIKYTDELRKLGYRLRFKQKEPFFEERLKKTPMEMKFIRDCLRDTSKAMEFARRMISSSIIRNNLLYLNGSELTSERIKGEINSFLSLLGYSASHTIVSCGIHSSMPHHTGEGPLLANKPIVVDIFPKSQNSGYYGDMTRTFVKGEPSKELKKMYRTVLRGQKIGISMVRDGVKVKEVHEEIVDFFRRSGFRTGAMGGKQQGFIHSTGHGLGLEIHEPPIIGLGEETLEEGNVVTVEPGLYYENIGGVRIEDVVVVKKKGCLNLTRYPNRFKV